VTVSRAGPDPFAGVVGQEPAVAALRALLERTAGSGSTLVVGPDGVGRFLLCLRAARAVLSPDGRAWERVDRLQHPDLLVLDTELGIPEPGIDGVRRVCTELVRRPVEAPRQVLIVRDAERLVAAAHNALLKTLEEPPAGASVFVVAESADALPETVVSRCRLVRARPLSPAATAEVLTRLGLDAGKAADAEGAPGRAVRQAELATGEAADALLALLAERARDPFAESDALVRRSGDEDRKAQRERLSELLRVAAARLRGGLPDPRRERALRSVLEALRSLASNAGPEIVFGELALLPWKTLPHP